MVKQLNTSHFSAYANGNIQPPDAIQPSVKMLQLTLKNGTVVTTSISRQAIIGRSDDVNRVDIDLTIHGGQEMGVSRQHLLVVQKDGRLFIKDNGSRNGSWLNNELLTQGVLCEIKSGDALRIGRLEAVVKIGSKLTTQRLAQPAAQPAAPPENVRTVNIDSLLRRVRDEVISD